MKRLASNLRTAVIRLIDMVWRDADKLNVSALALTLLAILRYKGNGSSVSLIDELRHNILAKQLPNGSWMNELWPTSLALWALRACEKVGLPDETTVYILPAFHYIDNTWCEQRANWQGEFLETILLSYVVYDTRLHDLYPQAKRAMARIKTLQAHGFFDIGDTALTMCALAAEEEATGLANRRERQKCAQWLSQWHYCEETPWNQSLALYAATRCGLVSPRLPRSCAWVGDLRDCLLLHTSNESVLEDHDEQAMFVFSLSSYWDSVSTSAFRERVPLATVFAACERNYSDNRNESRKSTSVIFDQKTVERLPHIAHAHAILFRSIKSRRDFSRFINAVCTLFDVETLERILKHQLIDISAFRTKSQVNLTHDLLQKCYERLCQITCSREDPSTLVDFRIVQMSVVGAIKELAQSASRSVISDAEDTTTQIMNEIAYIISDGLERDEEASADAAMSRQDIATALGYLLGQEGLLLLDLGCGKGTLINAMKEMGSYLKNLSYIGVNYPHAREAEKWARDSGFIDKVRSCVFFEMDKFMPTADVDVVAIIDVLHHLGPFQLARVMEIAYKSMKVGGSIIIIDTEKETELGAIRWTSGEMEKLWSWSALRIASFEKEFIVGTNEEIATIAKITKTQNRRLPRLLDRCASMYRAKLARIKQEQRQIGQSNDHERVFRKAKLIGVRQQIEDYLDEYRDVIKSSSG